MTQRSAAALSWTGVLRKSIVPLGLFSFVLNVTLLVPSLYMLQVYDRVLPSNSGETLIYITLMAVAALGLMAVLEVVRSLFSQRIAAGLDRSYAALAFKAALSGPRAGFGDIQPLRDLATLRGFIASRGLANLLDLPFLPFFLLVLYTIHPVLFVLTVFGAALLISVVVLNQMTGRRDSQSATEQATLANLTAQAFVKSAESVRAMGMKDNAVESWGEKFAAATVYSDRVGERNAIFTSLSRVLRMVLQLAILGTGAYLVLKGQMTAGMIFASSLISGRALQPIDQLIGGWKQTVEAHRALLRLDRAIMTQRDLKPRIELPTPRGDVAVRDLMWLPPYRPAGAPPVIKRLNFEIPAGCMLAVMGPSGAGKSTLVRMIAGALTPSGGHVSLDGADYRTWNEAQLGRSIGYLAQDVDLLPGTIAENIARFDPDSTDAKVVDAAQRAQAHDLVMGLADGYQTVVGGTSGIGLSGGMRQRIALARAFYGQPKLLILDEPNANLDAEGDMALERALDGAREAGTTVIIVTHRLAMASRCDQVMVLRNGSIEDFGPAVETLKKLRRTSGTNAPAIVRSMRADPARRVTITAAANAETPREPASLTEIGHE
ncbi:MAG: type I secretion system permease/ATPase [Proteobacteria bacterium]|nr:type I secretion system permease/ATPase [Pseudomonadota bacterium]